MHLEFLCESTSADDWHRESCGAWHLLELPRTTDTEHRVKLGKDEVRLSVVNTSEGMMNIDNHICLSQYDL